MRKLFLPLAGIFLFTISALQAQSLDLSLVLKNGTSEKTAITEIRKITFSGTDVTIIKKDGAIDNQALADLRKIVFVPTSTIGISKFESGHDQMKLYPNPAQNGFYVEKYLSTGGPVAIEMINLTGKTVKSIQLGNQPVGNFSFRIENDLPAGTYLFRLRTETGFSTGKILFIK